MAPPVHGNAETDLPEGVLYILTVDPGGETHIRTTQNRSVHETMACMAEVATLGRERYEVIPRTRGSLETGPPVASTA